MDLLAKYADHTPLKIELTCVETQALIHSLIQPPACRVTLKDQAIEWAAANGHRITDWDTFILTVK